MGKSCLFSRVLSLVALLAIAAGCAKVPKTVKVDGTVTLDGKPLSGATVTFVPEALDGHPAAGRTDMNGEFDLTTFSSADGAMPGSYKVVVTRSEPDKQTEGKNPMEMSDKEKAAFFMKMSPDGKAKEGPKKSGVSVPAVYGDASTTPLKQIVPAEGKVQVPLKSSAR